MTSNVPAAPPARAHARELRCDDVSAGYGRTPIVEHATLRIPPGRITVLIGPNGSGKSTLLKTMARVLPPLSGAVLLDGQRLTDIPTRRLATELGLLPQQPIAPEGIIVRDLVARGRHPYHRVFQVRNREDDAIIDESMRSTGVEDLADRTVDELSGGQRQRVWISMALAQRTDVLLLDEPTTYLDLTHQYEVLDLLTDLNRERGTTIVMVLHDINIAARYADHLIAIRSGRVHSVGTPREVITTETMSEVFALESRVIDDFVSGAPMVLPIGRHHRSRAETATGDAAETPAQAGDAAEAPARPFPAPAHTTIGGTEPSTGRGAARAAEDPAGDADCSPRHTEDVPLDADDSSREADWPSRDADDSARDPHRVASPADTVSTPGAPHDHH